MDIASLLERERQRHFSGIRGAAIAGSVPIRATLLNELAQVAVGAGGGAVKAISVDVPNDTQEVRVTAHVSKFMMTQVVPVDVQFDPAAQIGSSPTLGIEYSVGGMFGKLVEAIVGSMTLPPFVRLIGTRAIVDIGSLMSQAGYAELVPFIRAIEIRTEPGILWVDFALEVV